jgi:tripartite-type tricarboxylate transporter receptor subunit TctC
MVGFLVLLSVLCYFQVSAYAQTDVKAKLKAMKPKDYPTQPIEFVVVYQAGGGMDLTARVLGKYVEKYIGNRVVVINKTGGGGIIGHTYLATQAKNDGYTVGIIANSYWTDELTRPEVKWSYKEMEALAYINYDPRTWVISTKGALKDKSVKDIIEMVRQKPGSVKVGMTPGMQNQFLTEAVEMATGVKFTQVPFQGGNPAVIAVLGGHIDIAQPFYAEYRGHLEAGLIKILAVANDERYSYFPEVPTFNELLGVNDIFNISWRYAAAPKGLARDRFHYLEAAIDAALRDPECLKEFDQMGVKTGAKYMTSKQTEELIEKYYKIDKDFFIKTGRITKK